MFRKIPAVYLIALVAIFFIPATAFAECRPGWVPPSVNVRSAPACAIHVEAIPFYAVRNGVPDHFQRTNNEANPSWWFKYTRPHQWGTEGF
jgi:hypothetical protein